MPSVKNPREGTQGILEIVNEEKDKNLHSFCLPQFEAKNGQKLGGEAVAGHFVIFLERAPSL